MGFWNKEEERKAVEKKKEEEARQNAAKMRESRSNHDSRMDGMRERVAGAESSVQYAQDESNRILDDGFRKRKEERDRHAEREEETRRSNQEKEMKTVKEGNAKIEATQKDGIEDLKIVEEDNLYDDRQLEGQRNRLAEEHSRRLDMAQRTKNDREERNLQEKKDQGEKYLEEGKRLVERHENMQKDNERVLSEYQEAGRNEAKRKFEMEHQMGLNTVLRMNAMGENKKTQHSEQLEKSINTEWILFRSSYLNKFSRKRELRTRFEKDEWEKLTIMPNHILKDLSDALLDGNNEYQKLRNGLFNELSKIMRKVQFIILSDEPHSEESSCQLKELINSFGDLWMKRPKIETLDVFRLMDNTKSNAITDK